VRSVCVTSERFFISILFICLLNRVAGTKYEAHAHVDEAEEADAGAGSNSSLSESDLELYDNQMVQ